MRLDEIMRAVVADMRKRVGGPWVIARSSEGPRGYQVRFVFDASQKHEPVGIRLEGRRWVDQTDKISSPTRASARGTVGPYVGWSRWSAHLGFPARSVLADDWERVLKVEKGP